MEPYDLTICKGESFDKGFQLSTGGPVARGGQPIALTNCALYMQVRHDYGDTDLLLELTTENTGIVITDEANGFFAYNMGSDSTAALDFDRGKYDVFLVFPSGASKRLMRGTLYVEPAITDVVNLT